MKAADRRHGSTTFLARPIGRRAFLRGSGVALALPMLEALTPAGRAAPADGEWPRRLVCIETNMGIMPQFFFPEQTGRGFPLPPYLEKLAAHRDQFTVLSGVSHPGVTGGHAAEKCFLTGAPHPDRGGFRNSISLDQLAAEQLGHRTRYPSLVLAMTAENATLSYTRSGAPIPAEKSPRQLFEKLFLQGTAEEVASSLEALRQGRSMLDFVAAQSHRLSRSLAPADQSRLDAYYTSVRELERRLHAAEAWEHKPKPAVTARPPDDIEDAREFVARTRLMFDVMKLALETDSTRIISLFIDTTVIHQITHHGNRPEVVAELRSKEEAQFAALGDFLTALAATPEGGGSLLDRTMVLYGTPMGSANSHSNVNLPIMLAGGGFRHGQHLAFNTEHNHPLATLFVSMLQRLGLEVDRFATGTTTLRGLEMV